MNRRQRRLLGVIFVVLFGFGIFWAVRRRQASAAQEELLRKQQIEAAQKAAEADREMVTYVAPTQAIPQRTTITSQMVETRQVQKKVAPWAGKPGGSDPYPASLDKVVGQIALVDLVPGEPIRSERLAGADDMRAVSFAIDPKMRAVTIPIDPARAVGGFIRQGDFVDILGTFSIADGKQMTKRILQRVRILIVDKTFLKPERADARKADDERAKAEEQAKTGVPGNATSAYANVGMVTFEVTPEDAEKLVLASQKVPLTLALRNPTAPVVDEEQAPDTVAVDEVVFSPPGQSNLESEGTVEIFEALGKRVEKIGIR